MGDYWALRILQPRMVRYIALWKMKTDEERNLGKSEDEDKKERCWPYVFVTLR